MKTQIVALSLAGLVALTGCSPLITTGRPGRPAAHSPARRWEAISGSQVGEGQGQLAATAVGVVLGGMLGQAIGQSVRTRPTVCRPRRRWRPAGPASLTPGVIRTPAPNTI